MRNFSLLGVILQSLRAENSTLSTSSNLYEATITPNYTLENSREIITQHRSQNTSTAPTSRSTTTTTSVTLQNATEFLPSSTSNYNFAKTETTSY